MSANSRNLPQISDVTDLALPQERSALVQAIWTPREVETLKATIAKGLDNLQLKLFVEVCSHLALDPFQKQIYGIVRSTKQSDGSYAKALVIQIGIDGYRALAERSGMYAGQSQPYWCGADGQWTDVWLRNDPPAAAKVEVYRVGEARPTVAVCRYASFVQRDKQGNPSGKWGEMPEHMLAVRAESHALRKAFPNVMEQVKREVKGAALVEIEGYQPDHQLSEVLLPALETGDDYNDVPSDDDVQFQEYRQEIWAAKSNIELNTVLAEAARAGYEEALQQDYLAKRAELPATTRRRAV